MNNNNSFILSQVASFTTEIISLEKLARMSSLLDDIQGFHDEKVAVLFKVLMLVLRAIKITSGVLSFVIIGPILALVLFDFCRYVVRLLSIPEPAKTEKLS